MSDHSVELSTLQGKLLSAAEQLDATPPTSPTRTPQAIPPERELPEVRLPTEYSYSHSITPNCVLEKCDPLGNSYVKGKKYQTGLKRIFVHNLD